MARILITGSTDGIGLRTAQVLGETGHEVILHGRSPDRVAAACTAVGPAAVAGFVADFTDLDQVAELAGQTRELGIDVLINNAGVYSRQRTETIDGHEQMWQVNYLAASLLTQLTMAQLLRGGRVVTVTSSIHQRGEIDLVDPDFRTKRWHHFKAHAQTKLAGLMMTLESARRNPDVTFLAVHPGMVSTKLLTEGMKVPGTDTLDQAAATSVWAATATGVPSGSYLAHERIAQPCPNALDEVVAADLYDHTITSLGLAPA